MKKINSLLSLALVALAITFTSCQGDPSVAINHPESISIDLNDVETPFLEGSIVATDDVILEEYFSVNFNTELPGVGKSYCFDTIIHDKSENKVECSFSYNIQSFGQFASMIPMFANMIESVTIDVKCEQVNQSVTIPVTIILKNDLAEEAFQWKREGGNEATGLEMFGLQWQSNVKEVFCVIKPLEGVKLVVFPEESAETVYGVTTSVELASAIEELPAVEDFRGVSATKSGEYNYVIGTRFNNQYFLMNITKGTVETGAPVGTIITIDGNCKHVPTNFI